MVCDAASSRALFGSGESCRASSRRNCCGQGREETRLLDAKLEDDKFTAQVQKWDQICSNDFRWVDKGRAKARQKLATLTVAEEKYAAKCSEFKQGMGCD